MANRFVRWIGFSVLLTLFPIILSIFTKIICNIEVALNSYNNELLFMAVMLSTTSIGDFMSIMQKGVRGVHITAFVIILIFIALLCISCYEILSVASFSNIELNYTLISRWTILGVSASLIIGGISQYFLEKVGA